MRKEFNRIRISKFLSLILRHQPEEIGLELGQGGWAAVDELITKANRHGVDLDRAVVDDIVETDSKDRLEISPDGERIRARYGHSLDVNLGYQRQEPPQALYHGTAWRFLVDINKRGLLPKGRTHVHLSSSRESALQVGQRHGQPVILRVDAQGMHEDGHAFYPSTDQVWLVKRVPVEYIRFPG